MVEKIEINLIPAEYVVREKKFSINLSIFIPVIISLGLICLALIWLNMLNMQAEKEKINIANLDREIEVNKTIQQEIKVLEQKQNEMQVKVTGLKSINVNRAKWVDAFELYADIIPENTWLTAIEEDSTTGIIKVSGMTEADAEVGQFMNRLFDSPSIVGVNLVEMKDAGRSGHLKSFAIQHSFIINEN
jgi:Tfp pilus assembly protein PilN